MKILYICRHGKAELTSLSGIDFDRNLVLKGMLDAKKNSKTVKNNGAKPDLLISSTANRAFQTATQYACRFELEINSEPSIYEASLKSLLSVLNSISEKHKQVMVFGHNPGFSILASYLSGKNLGDLATASCVAIQFENQNWGEIGANSGKVVFEVY